MLLPVEPVEPSVVRVEDEIPESLLIQRYQWALLANSTSAQEDTFPATNTEEGFIVMVTEDGETRVSLHSVAGDEDELLTEVLVARPGEKLAGGGR